MSTTEHAHNQAELPDHIPSNDRLIARPGHEAEHTRDTDHPAVSQHGSATGIHNGGHQSNAGIIEYGNDSGKLHKRPMRRDLGQ